MTDIFSKQPRSGLIDLRFADVDLIPPPGQLGGALPIDEQQLACSAGPAFEEAFELLPQNEWDDWIDAQAGADALDTHIRNQGNEGSCVGNGTAAMFDRLQMLQGGEIIVTSAMDLYKRIGRSAQSGAYLGDALEKMKTRGILPEDTPENKARFKHVHPATGFSNRLPEGGDETRAFFKIDEYWPLNSFEGTATALLRHGLGVVYARNSHSICGWRIVKDNGVYYCKYKNSWWINGEPWGDGGYGYDSERKLRGTWQGWFAARSTVVRFPLLSE